jgi:hypothetical protein
VTSGVAALVLALLVTPACGTVDIGPTTGPPEGCNASPAFFVQRVWPEYLDKYGCGRSDCHDSVSGHGYFRLESVANQPSFDPTQPTSNWPEPWRFNLISATRVLNCADATSSLIDAVPTARGLPHPPGDVVTDHDAADKLMKDWAAAR